MTGRGRPRKVKSPDAKPKGMKLTSPVRYKSPVRFTIKEKQKETTKTTKKRDQQMPNHTEEKPPGPRTRKEKTANPLTKEIQKQPRMPTESTKAKTCSATRTLMEDSPGDSTKTRVKMQPDIPMDVRASVKSTQDKAPNSKAKLQGLFNKDPTKMEQLAEKSQKLSTVAAKEKKGAAIQRITKKQPDRTEDPPKSRTEENVDHILRMTLETLKIKKAARSDASQVINDFIKQLIKHLRNNSEIFGMVEEPLRTGSYYENLKISDPDEFDVMLPIPVKRVHIEPFGQNGAFYSVSLKRDQNPVKKFQIDNILSGCKMLGEFRQEVEEFAKRFPEWEITSYEEGCPAVTLITKVKSVIISLDVVLCLEVKSHWPPFTKDGFKIEEWLGTKVKQEHKWKPYYLVPKYEGRGSAVNDGIHAKDVWRISFSHVEKDIIKNHGSEKTCCERAGAKCCRKECLKLLKHLLHLLKEKDSSLDKFCSYHVKTTLLHACCARIKDGQWKASDLSDCFKRLLQDFEGHLRNRELYNFFVPSHNLLCDLENKLCKNLADRIKEQQEWCFPVFKEYLQKAN